MTPPLVTVITVRYNAASLIEETIFKNKTFEHKIFSNE